MTPIGPGTLVGGRFRLEAEVAEGGMGVVYRATEVRERDGVTRTLRTVAVKLIHARFAGDPGYLERFQRETEIVVGLQHPNIVPVFDVGEHDGRPYIAMAWIDGPTLGERIRRAGSLTLEETLRLLTPVAAALDAAHDRGLVHRDVKPGNILVSGRDEAYLTDFGLTRPMDALSAPTVPGGRVHGTAPFIAPEQLRPATIQPALAARIDVYALACVIFACLTGDGPFSGDSEEATLFAHAFDPPPALSARRPDLPRGLDPVLAAALAKDPAVRPASAGQLIGGLRAVAAAPVPADPDMTRPTPIPGPGPSGAARLPRPTRAPVVAGAAGLVVIALAAVVIAASGPGGGPGPSSSLVAGAPTGRAATVPPTPGEATARTTAAPTRVPTPAPTAPPTPFGGDAASQAVLLASLPATATGCVPRQLSGREIAAVNCAVEGADLADYGLYRSIEAMQADWAAMLGREGYAPDTGNCAEGKFGEAWWYYTDPERVLGRIFCHVNVRGAAIHWTDEDYLVWGYVDRLDEDTDAVFQAWKRAIIPRT